MNDQLNFRLPVPSLKHMSLARLGLSFIYPAIESGAITFTGRDEADSLLIMKKTNAACKVVLELSKEYIPKDYKEWFSCLICRNLQIMLREYTDVQRYFYTSHETPLPKELILRHSRFTPRGTLNIEKTVSSIADDDQFDLFSRFELVCYYWLEEPIRVLWARMNPPDLEHFDIDILKDEGRLATVYWSLKILGVDEDEIYDYVEQKFDVVMPEPLLQPLLQPLEDEGEDRLLSVEGLLFRIALRCGLEIPKHFFDKMDEEERTYILDRTNVRPHLPQLEFYFVYMSFLSRPQWEREFQNRGVYPLFDAIYPVEPWNLNELVPQLFEFLLPLIDEENYFWILLCTTAGTFDNPWDVPTFNFLWSHHRVPQSHRDYVLNKRGKDGIVRLLYDLYFQSFLEHRQWSLHIILRCLSKDQFRPIFSDVIDEFQTYGKEEKEEYEGLLKICARKMISSKYDLDYVRKVSSPILHQEENWRLFLSEMEHNLDKLDK